MIHPHTVIRTVSPEIGNGVFATEWIPRGTIIVVRDGHDLILSNEAFAQLPAVMRNEMETFMYRDREGNLVLGWDHARYMNHNCNSNTLMTSYNLEIAVRDIAAGEEVTTDYGLLNVIEPYPVHCGCVACREHLQLDDIDRYAEGWDALILESMQRVDSVDQPLMAVMQEVDRTRLRDLLQGCGPYESVRALKWRPSDELDEVG